MKKQALRINKETIRILSSARLVDVVGGIAATRGETDCKTSEAGSCPGPTGIVTECVNMSCPGGSNRVCRPG